MWLISSLTQAICPLVQGHIWAGLERARGEIRCDRRGDAGLSGRSPHGSQMEAEEAHSDPGTQVLEPLNQGQVPGKSVLGRRGQ